LAGAGPGLLSKEAMRFMSRHETIGVNTTIKYPEVKKELNHWITCDGRMITPGNPHNIVEYLKDGEFDKYVWQHPKWEAFGEEIYRLKWFKNSWQPVHFGFSGN